MAISCEPADLAENAKCFCYDKNTEGAVLIYLLMQIAELDLTASELAALAAPYTGMPKDAKESAIVYLSCAAATAAGA